VLGYVAIERVRREFVHKDNAARRTARGPSDFPDSKRRLSFDRGPSVRANIPDSAIMSGKISPKNRAGLSKTATLVRRTYARIERMVAGDSSPSHEINHDIS
jgi:hypothetical protein